MSDIKLFRTAKEGTKELAGESVQLEKSLQRLLEAELEVFLGVKFLASEHPTGKTHAGRIDTLGIDENGFPVIIEYKRSLNENVINQGLFYLDWLLDHRGEFELMVMKALGKEVSETINWSAPRLLCIAGDYTRYDQHAVQQINRNIELIRYKRFGADLLMLELVNATTGPASEVDAAPAAGRSSAYPTVSSLLAKADQQLVDLFESLKAFVLALGEDVQEKTLKNYFAFKRFQNFACVEVHPQKRHLSLYLKVDPEEVALENGFTRDVRDIGHFGTGDLEVTVSDANQLERAKPLIVRSYEAS